jgi:hypothetical protein
MRDHVLPETISALAHLQEHIRVMSTELTMDVTVVLITALHPRELHMPVTSQRRHRAEGDPHT